MHMSQSSVSAQHIPIPGAIDCATLENQRSTKAKENRFQGPRLALSVDHEVADMLTEDLQLEFARGALEDSSACQDQGDVVGLIVDTFKTAWRFTMLSVGRWGTVGPASQAVVLAALCGLENLVCRSFAPKSGRSRIIWVVFVHGAGRHCAQGKRQLFASLTRAHALAQRELFSS